jgi:4-alpha-glucanotransferase
MNARGMLAGPLAHRRAGVLLHPTSLPGPSAVGELGPDAFKFVDLLAACGITVWQTLPLGPAHEDNSPYQCLSVHAGSDRLISLQNLVDRGWLRKNGEIHPGSPSSADRRALLRRARAGFEKHATDEDRERYANFRDQQAHWLEDFALYQAIRSEHQNRSWLEWHRALRDRHAGALDQARKRLAEEVAQARFEQFVFFQQWGDLRRYAHERGIYLFGDMPIFVAHDSADVWAARDIFALDADGRLQVVAGVPPDYFSATGQRWGNPHYRWDRVEEQDFRWWVERLRTQLSLFDLIRIDHFRGFEKYWEIPADSETAQNGHWVEAPGARLFRKLETEFDHLPLVAEDLGLITPEVEALRHQFGLPGMKILQFAFDSDSDNPYLPHNHEPDYVVYTGTHDNDTTVGWFDALGDEQRYRVREYLGHPGEAMPWPLIRAGMMSVTRLAVVPLQDFLSLDSRHRMNTPGRSGGNWSWRFRWEQVPEDLAERVSGMVQTYGRAGG